MPDEYLPPNKILFLQNLPEAVTKDQLNGLFAQYAPPFPASRTHAVYTDLAVGQISQFARGAAYPDEERHRVRRVRGRRERDGRQGRATQLQARWREQDQGLDLFRAK